MINSEDFAKRLEKVINFYGETASSFSEKIGVQRSSISHILSGRNKPSLDFVLKVLSEFPEVELYWLLNGKGNFPSTLSATSSAAMPHIGKKESPGITPALQIPKSECSNDKSIERIIIFYKDGTFKNFEQS